MDDPERKRRGLHGEDAALAHLSAAGLKLIERNFRCKTGEIDLVMLDGSTLVLVEVRYRSSQRFGGAAASITWHKRQRLASAARRLLLARADLRGYPARFDVVAICPSARGQDINWIRNAFTL